MVSTTDAAATLVAYLKTTWQPLFFSGEAYRSAAHDAVKYDEQPWKKKVNADPDSLRQLRTEVTAVQVNLSTPSLANDLPKSVIIEF